MLDRLFKVLCFIAVSITIGLVYGYVIVPMGLAIKCPFYLITGLKCPGCGVTTACVYLMHGKFKKAISANLGMVFILLPLCYILITNTVRYIKGLKIKNYPLLSNTLLIFMIVWFFVRNYYHI